MKHNCDVVRDLMPLCIDDTASQESRKTVLAHVSECDDCLKVYEEMKQALPPNDAPDELRPEVKLIARARRRRLWKRLIAFALVFVLLVTGAWSLLDNMRHVWMHPVNPADYDLLLSRRTNGDVIVTTQRLNGKTMSYFTQYDHETGIVVFGMESFLLPGTVDERFRSSSNRDDSLIWIDGEGMFIDMHSSFDPADHDVQRTRVNEIWSNGELLYRHGDDIPLASEQLEEYMHFFDQLYGTRDDYWARWAEYWEEQASVESHLAANQSLHDQMYSLGPNIPEWQE